MDLALQASPDHPWVTKHPEWFTTRADGSIAYAENPPKKYQDIYPLNFDNDPEGIYAEVHRLVRHWMDHGVRIFRVDNPHTKPLPFWQRLLADIAATDPDVIFLAEAFTRPAMMHALAAIGFHQSYTYFTWRNTAAELTEYMTGAGRPGGRLHAAQLLRQHPRHPVPVPPARGAAGVRGPGGTRLDAVAPPGACTPVTSSARTSRWCRAARSTWTRRSTPTGRGTGTARPSSGLTIAPLLTRLNADQARPSGPALAAQSALPLQRPAGHPVLLQADEPRFPRRARHRSCRGKPGPQ